MSWSNTSYGAPAGYNVWSNYVSSCDPILFNYPKGGSSGVSYNGTAGTLASCASQCNSNPLCMGFGRSAWQLWSWTATTNPDDPNSTAAYCQLYYSWKNPSDNFISITTGQKNYPNYIHRENNNIKTLL